MESNAREAHLRDLRACEHRGLMMSDEERNLRLGSVRGDRACTLHAFFQRR
jgi:hypothetical protein